MSNKFTTLYVQYRCKTECPKKRLPLNSSVSAACSNLNVQGPRKIVKGGGGANIHIFVFTDLENNGFQKKLIRQNMNI